MRELFMTNKWLNSTYIVKQTLFARCKMFAMNLFFIFKSDQFSVKNKRNAIGDDNLRTKMKLIHPLS